MAEPLVQKADTFRMRSRKEATQQMTIDVTTETYTHVSTTTISEHALDVEHADPGRRTPPRGKRPT